MNILERNAEGVTKMGPITFNVPNNRSALSMMDQNINHGDDFNSDGWIYNNNQKLRKWFVTLSGTSCWTKPAKVWEQRFTKEEIPKLEQKYHNIQQWVQNKIYSTHDKMVADLLPKCPFCAIHRNRWFTFEIYKDKYISYGTASEKEAQEYKLDQEAGDYYLRIEKRMRECQRRLMVVELGFLQAICNAYYEPKILDLTINNRRYVLIQNTKEHREFDYEFLAKPEEILTETLGFS